MQLELRVLGIDLVHWICKKNVACKSTSSESWIGRNKQVLIFIQSSDSHSYLQRKCRSSWEGAKILIVKFAAQDSGWVVVETLDRIYPQSSDQSPYCGFGERKVDPMTSPSAKTMKRPSCTPAGTGHGLERSCWHNRPDYMLQAPDRTACSWGMCRDQS